MFELISQNRLVALGLLLIAGYGVTAYSDWDSESDAFAPNVAVSAGPSPDAIADEDELEAPPSRAAAPPPPPAGFYEDVAEGADDELLIDDAAGFDPSPEFDGSPIAQEPSASSRSSGPRRVVRSDSGSAGDEDVSIIVDNDEIEAGFN